MLLSIGMIVKNEEKYLDQCLTALKPLLDAVDSELIIADTGSTDNTVEIAKKHTDKVYYFEWINDFSAARNFTMQQSSGEWFMFLDADEVFQSCDELINFFTNGDCKIYASASVIIRSYSDETNFEIYSDSNNIRLAKRFDDVTFVNPIHEAITPVHIPLKRLRNTIADHFGYFFRKDGVVTELARKKCERNLKMLLTSLEQDQENVEMSVYREIADCYNIIDDEEKSREYLIKGLQNLDHSFVAIVQYYCFLAVSYLNSQMYEQVIETCDEYFDKDINTFRDRVLAADSDMLAVRGESYYRLGEYEKALENFIPFFKVRKDYDEGRLETADLLYNSIRVKEKNVKIIYLMLIDSLIHTAKYNTANEYLKKNKYVDNSSERDIMLNFMRLKIKVLEHTGYNGIKKFVSQLDDHNKAEFYKIARWQAMRSENIEQFLAGFKGVEDKNTAFGAALEIYKSFFITKNVSFEQIQNYVDKYGSAYNIDILAIALACGFNISPFLEAADMDIPSTVHALFTDYPDYLHYLENIDIQQISKSALRYAAAFYGRAMVEADIDKEKEIDRVKLLEKYGETASRWKEEFPDEQNIPGDIQAGLIVHSITSAHAVKDYKLCISEMRRLVKVCPEFAPFIKDYQQMIKAEIKPVTAQPVQQTPQMTQMEQMAAMVKNNIRTMIAAGDLEKASSTLAELYTLVPNDKELSAIKAEIAQKNQMAQMAAIVKNNIRIMISAGNTEAALKNLNELKSLVPYDAELPEIEKEIHQKDGEI